MKILEGFNPIVMYKGDVIWGILWLNLHFPLKVGIFRKFSGIFSLFLAITLVLAINLAEIINFVLFYIKINIFVGQLSYLLGKKIVIFFHQN